MSVDKGHGLTDFITKVSKGGGMSFSNNFVVEIKGKAAKYFPDQQCVEFFCDEAQLPNMNTATGTQVGLYTGLGAVDYPHTRVFTEFSLTFMLDANLTLLKYLNSWYFDIFGERVPGMTANALPENRTTRVAYKDSYVGDIHISKTEMGLNSSIDRKPITYVMEQAFPYQIDAVPLQFGSSQITKVTAQFKYQRHYTKVADVSAAPQMKKGDVKEYLRDDGPGKSKPRLVKTGPDGNLYTWPELTPPPPIPPTTPPVPPAN